MNNMSELAEIEVAAANRHWGTGGSDLYPRKVEKRPRPARAQVPPPEQEYEDVFFEALEHISWCRDQGMTPQCVADSISQHKKLRATTWPVAISLIEAEIWTMRDQLRAGQ